MVYEDVWVARPPFTYDGITSGRGFALWRDDVGGGTRLIAAQASGTDLIFYYKSLSAETYTSIVNIPGAIVRDFTNLNGWMYFTVSPTSGTSYQPIYFVNNTAAMLNGYPLGAAAGSIGVNSLAAFKSRLFFGGVDLSIDNLILRHGSSYPYDMSSWTRTSLSASSATVGSSIIYSVTPTATSGSKSELLMAALTESYSPSRWLSALRNTSTVTPVPMKIEIKHDEPWSALTTYVVGMLVTPTTPNGKIYKCTTGGTSAAGEPVWPTTISSTIVDGGVLTWTCIATDVIATNEFVLPPVGPTGSFSIYSAAGSPLVDGAGFRERLVLSFGNTVSPTYTIVTVDVGLKDGLADGTTGKQNYGQQLTRSDFEFPFCNVESAVNLPAIVKQRSHIYWTELDTSDVSATNYYRIASGYGDISAIRAAMGKLLVFTRKSRWIFGATEDVNIVILPEGDERYGSGCLGAKAMDVSDHDGSVFYVSENGVYRWTLDSDPEELCDEAMLRDMFNKSAATWVESQASPANRALLAIDQKNKRVLVYVQKGRVHCYDMRRKAWSEIDAGGDTSTSPVGYQICDMIYNPTTGNVYFDFTESATGTAGVARLDASQADALDQISSSGTLTVHKDIWTRPIELSEREDLCLEEMQIHHAITASQSGQTLTALYSFDQGITFNTFETLTVSPISGGEYDPIVIPFYQSWGTLLPRFLHSGKGGKTSFNVSRISARVKTLTSRGEYPKETP